MNAGSLPLSTWSRSGPTLPAAPASDSVWQPEQPVEPEVKIALPSAVPPPPACGGALRLPPAPRRGRGARHPAGRVVLARAQAGQPLVEVGPVLDGGVGPHDRVPQ